MSKLPLGARAASLLVLAATSACSGKPAPRSEGFVHVEGGRVWYHRVGSGNRTPVVLLHGGPGSCSYYMKPLLALAADRPVIIYDQLGCGKSDRPTDTTLFTVDRYVRELQTLRDSLGLTEIHLFGHSWGGMLAAAYMGTHPAGVRSLIMSSPVVTTAQWVHDADSMIKELPDSVQRAIAKHEADHTTDSPEYQAAMNVYYGLHLMRKPPLSKADADSSNTAFSKQIYEYMWGPSEFTSTGTLKNFDATDWLKSVSVPSLFLAGQYGEEVPASIERFSKLVPGSQFVMIPGSAHVTHNDNLPAVLSAVRHFLDSVETRH
jgi:proline iminopeptidase